MTNPTPAGWYPDPENGSVQRWWNGVNWTNDVQAASAAPGQATEWQQRHAVKHLGTGGVGAAPTSAGPGAERSPWTEQRLFVSQKRKLVELTNEYAVFGTDGVQVGAVVEVGQSGLKKAARFLTSFDQFMTHTVEIRDAQARTVAVMTRPKKVFKSTMIVSSANGVEIGRLVQRNVFGKIRFAIEVNGQEIGSLNAENWRAWNFAILDGAGTEIARITKTWEGLLTTVFTTADNYLVDMHAPLSEPMHSLVVAAALTVDTALKQDARGFG